MNIFWTKKIGNLSLMHKPMTIKNKKLITLFPVECERFNANIQKKYVYILKNEGKHWKKEIYRLKELFIRNFDENCTILSFYHLNNYKRYLDRRSHRILKQRLKFALEILDKKDARSTIGASKNTLVVFPCTHNDVTTNMIGLVNLSKTEIPSNIKHFLMKGPKHTIGVCGDSNMYSNYTKKTDVEIMVRSLINTEYDTYNCDRNIISQSQNRDLIELEQEALKIISKTNAPKNNIIYDNIIIKEMKKFLKEHDLTISKADKTDTLVLIDRKQYDDLMNIALKENNFVICDFNDNKSNERRLQCIIRKLKKRGTINGNEYNLIIPTGSLIPNIFNTIKIHKDPVSFRLIVNGSESFNAKINTWLNKKLSIYAESIFHLKNSLDLINRLNKLKINKNCIMFSLDIKNMFSNIDVSTIIEHILHMHKFAKEQVFDIPLPLLDDLLHLCASSTSAFYNGNLYKQTGGIAMGNGLASLFAKFAINITLDKLTNNKSIDLLGVYCFVDDIICIGNYDNADKETLEFLMNSNTMFDFTIEREKDNRLNFLDITIFRHDNQFDYTVYRKITKNDIRVNFNSLNSYTTKINVLTQEIIRAYKICSTEYCLMNELKSIFRIYIANDYPERLIKKVIMETNQKFTSNVDYKDVGLVQQNETSLNNKDFRPIRIKNRDLNSFFNNRIKELKFNTNWENINKLTVPKIAPLNSFKSLKNVNKPDRMVNNVNNVIYLLECEKQDCKSRYLGQTKRMILDRVSEHLGRDKMKSTVGLHSQLPGHSFGVSTKEINIIGKERDLQRHLVFETIAIRDIKPELNNYECGTSLSTVV